MSALTDFDLDDTGKIDLNNIYDQPDPRSYYQTIFNLDYRIPAEAEPVFQRVIETLRKNRDGASLTILDVGSSYGVNAALLKHNRVLSDLYDFYGPSSTAGLSRRDLISRDRAFFDACDADSGVRFVGLDVAGNAVGYARDAGIIDAGIVADLETGSPSEGDRALLTDVDLVISTGAIGYVGAPTFERILDCARSEPWFAVFALRMFPIDEIAAVLRAHGYAVFRLAGRTFRQRRFAGREEAAEVFANLGDLGLDPAGLESGGWYHAEFFFAWPASSRPAPLPGLVRI